MDWLQDVFESHGGTVIGVLAGLVVLVVLVAIADGWRGRRDHGPRRR